MNNILYLNASAEIDIYNEELRNQDCKISGKIIHFTPIQKNNCTTLYDTIIKDNNSTYYQIIIQENKPYYRDLSGTKAKEISCSWAYEDLWNSITPKIWDNYFFSIKWLYNEYYNYAYKISNETNNNEDKWITCQSNIIDKIETIESQQQNIINIENFKYMDYISYWIIIFLIWIIVILAFKLKQKSNS